MAKCETKNAPTYVLELSKIEADALFAILQFVGGPPRETRRGLIDIIRRALTDSGVQDDGDDISRDAGGILFEEISK